MAWIKRSTPLTPQTEEAPKTEEAVAEKENIACEGDDYESYIEGVLGQVGASREELFEQYGEGFVNYSYLTDRAYSLLNERVVVK